MLNPSEQERQHAANQAAIRRSGIKTGDFLTVGRVSSGVGTVAEVVGPVTKIVAADGQLIRLRFLDSATGLEKAVGIPPLGVMVTVVTRTGTVTFHPAPDEHATKATVHAKPDDEFTASELALLAKQAEIARATPDDCSAWYTGESPMPHIDGYAVWRKAREDYATLTDPQARAAAYDHMLSKVTTSDCPPLAVDVKRQADRADCEHRAREWQTKRKVAYPATALAFILGSVITGLGASHGDAVALVFGFLLLVMFIGSLAGVICEVRNARKYLTHAKR